MKTFKDINGKEYSLQLTIGTVKRLRNTINFDILNLFPSSEGNDRHVVFEIYDDDVLAVSVAYHALGESVGKDTTEDQFLEKFDGECASKLKEALLEEIRLFFLKSKRKEVAEAMTKWMEAKKELQILQVKQVTEADAKAMAGAMFTSSQESSESIQTL